MSDIFTLNAPFWDILLRTALVYTTLREHGITDRKDVEMAVLEIDGTISVVPVGDHTLRTRKISRFLRK